MADSLEELRQQLNGGAFPPATGPFRQGKPPMPAPSPPEPEGFDAGDVWRFPYNLNPYVNAQGEIPPPSQERLNRFNRAMGKLMVDYQNAAAEAEKADAQARKEVAEKQERGEVIEPELVTMEIVEEAIAEKEKAISRVKDAVADLCNGKPTRKQLESLPE